MTKATKVYVIQMSALLGAYMVCLMVAMGLLKDHPQAAWRYPVALLPIVPALFIPFAVRSFIRQMDEMQRRIQLEGMGFAFAASAVVTFAYGLLQNTGLPQVNWMWVWPVMAPLWCLGLVIARRRCA
jgi:hypothetical protein